MSEAPFGGTLFSRLPGRRERASLPSVYYEVRWFAMTIAFFDSGMGGLSVLHHAMHEMKGASFLFYADEDHVPYGVRSKEEIMVFVREAFDFLVEKGVDAIVTACNTATSVAAKTMRARYDIPIIGMEPAVKFALDRDGAHRVLVTATPLTVKGKKMQRLLGRVDKAHLVDLLALPELVSFAERLEFRSPAVRTYLEKELAPYDLEAYSSLVLGCTHFNYFKETLREIFPAHVSLLDGNAGTVREVKRQLAACGIEVRSEAKETTYYYSGRRVEGKQELARLHACLKQLDKVFSIV